MTESVVFSEGQLLHCWHVIMLRSTLQGTGHQCTFTGSANAREIYFKLVGNAGEVGVN